jgi:hypothetical protein
MQKFILTLLVTFSFVPLSHARDKILIAGDSWSFLPCVFSSAQQAFWAKKLNADIVDCQLTSQAGVRADNFREKYPHKWIKKILKQRNDITAIYFSIGGNDLIRWWDINMTPQDELAYFLSVRDHVAAIIADFHKIRPNVKVLVTGYDYARFKADHPISAYARAYKRMGLPTPAELHSGFKRFSDVMASLKEIPNVYYMHHYGVMHYYHGAPDKGVPPGMTLPPDQISTPIDPTSFGGVFDAQNPRSAMLKIGKLVTDAFHLDKFGFQKLIEHAIDMYLKSWVKD